jgi:nicotinic acid mononucleotide adenylyltransferase
MAEKAGIYLLLTDETAEDFYSWTQPLYIVEHATLVYGNRPGTTFDKEKLIDKLRKIDAVARQQGIIETATNAELTEMVKQGVIQGAKISVKTGTGETVEMDIPAAKIRPIHPKVIDALDHGHVPVTGTKVVSSTEIRNNIQNGLPIAELVGEKVAAMIERHGLYKETI